MATPQYYIRLSHTTGLKTPHQLLYVKWRWQEVKIKCSVTLGQVESSRMYTFVKPTRVSSLKCPSGHSVFTACVNSPNKYPSGRCFLAHDVSTLLMSFCIVKGDTFVACPRRSDVVLESIYTSTLYPILC